MENNECLRTPRDRRNEKSYAPLSLPFIGRKKKNSANLFLQKVRFLFLS
jgi:hypothetical protein